MLLSVAVYGTSLGIKHTVKATRRLKRVMKERRANPSVTPSTATAIDSSIETTATTTIGGIHRNTIVTKLDQPRISRDLVSMILPLLIARNTTTGELVAQVITSRTTCEALVQDIDCLLEDLTGDSQRGFYDSGWYIMWPRKEPVEMRELYIDFIHEVQVFRTFVHQLPHRRYQYK